MKTFFAKYSVSGNLLSSVVVFLIALPLCMGIAIASGVPPSRGLLTGIIGGIVAGLLAGSPLQVSGPAAGLAVMVFEIVRDHGLSMLGPILLVAGLIQLTAGFLKLGQWFRAISPDVIYGMLAGIGILIAAAQFHVMLDDSPKANGLANLTSIPLAIFGGIFPLDGSKHEIAVLVGIGTILTLVLWEKFRPAQLKAVPGALLGVVLASVATLVFSLPVKLVSLPENLLSTLSVPSGQDLSKLLDPSLILLALGIAFIASAETLLSASAVDQMHTGPRTDYDRELMAQGIGNLLCGSIGALPMTGVIVRSAANVNAGATNRLSTIFHGFWILLFVLAVPGLLQSIPTCALAAILVYTGYKLVHVENIRKLGEYGKLPIVIYAATVIGIVTTDLLKGVMLGLGLSLIKLIYKATHLRINLEHNAETGRADLTLYGVATFLAIPQLAKALESLPPEAQLHVHIKKLGYIDHACIEMLSNWEKQNSGRGSRLFVEWEGLHSRYHRNEITRAATEDAG